jgi:hypothetical protein
MAGRFNPEHTVKNGPVSRQKTVLQTLDIFSRFEGILLGNDLMNILSRKQRYLVTSMTVEDSEESQPVSGGVGVLANQVEHRSVGVLHANTPALHGRHAVGESIISALFGSLLILREHSSQRQVNYAGSGNVCSGERGERCVNVVVVAVVVVVEANECLLFLRHRCRPTQVRFKNNAPQTSKCKNAPEQTSSHD